MYTVNIPFWAMADSYKASHYNLYNPDIDVMSAYTEARKGLFGLNTPILFYGLNYIIDNFVNKQWTKQDIEEMDDFYSDFNAGGTQHPYPRDLFISMIEHNDGYFPVTIKALREGTLVYPRTALYTLVAQGKYAPLCTYLESVLMQCWYPTTVGTLSFMTKELIRSYFDMTVDPDAFWKLDSRLHDFGYRGTTCNEQAMLGGAAHLLNFTGSDTLSAAYYVKKYLNNNKARASSIPATEHSIMTTHTSEEDAVKRMINIYGDGVYATVADSYSYNNFINNITKKVKALKESKKGFWVLRPDSGEPVEQVLNALRSGDKVFGSFINQKGYKVLNGVGVIQGDGIDYHVIASILEAVKNNGFSVENVAFGMGGGLLQKVNRDTLSFVTKVDSISMLNEINRKDIMKAPEDSKSSKTSLPGRKAVKFIDNRLQTVPIDYGKETNQLNIVYDCGKSFNAKTPKYTFDETIKYIEEQRQTLPYKVLPDDLLIHLAMQAKISSFMKNHTLKQ